MVKNQEEAASLPEDEEEEEDGGEIQYNENVNKFLFLPGLMTIWSIGSLKIAKLPKMT